MIVWNAHALLAAALQQIRQPVILIDGEQKILSTNETAIHLLEDGSIFRSVQGVLVAPHEDGLSLSSLFAEDKSPENTLLRFADGADGYHEFSVRRLRLGGRTTDGSVFMIIGRGRPLSSFSLIARYSLTKAEADLVMMLIRGSDLSEIATISNVSKHTVRKYMQSIFQKIGVNRQVDLVRRIFEDHDWGLG